MKLPASNSPRSALGALLLAGLLVAGCDKQAPDANKKAEAAPAPAPAAPAAAPEVTPPAAPAAEPAAAPAEPVAAPAAEAPDYNGSYANSSGIKLTIEKFEAGKGFDFAVSSGGDGDCGGLAYSGAAKFGEDGSAKSDEEDLFKFDNGAVNFEPSVEMVGMDCAREVDTEFKKQ